MWLNYFTVHLIPFILVTEGSGELITDENRAREFLRSRDEAILRRCEAKEEHQYFLLDTRANDFSWQNFSDPLLKRAFQKTAEEEAFLISMKAQNNTELLKKKKRLNLRSRLIYIYSGACVYHDDESEERDETCTWLSLDKVFGKFYNIGNAEERKYYWTAWRDYVGKMKNVFVERLNISKESNDSFEYPQRWLNSYEETSPSILADVDRAFQEILPLYKELHAFVRRRLINTYRNERISRDGPIPSHLLDLISKSWLVISDVALPFPQVKVDITGIMKEKNMTAIDLLKLAEDFYHSIGLPNISDEIWSNSTISTNKDCEFDLVYHVSCNKKPIGIRACAPINELYLHYVIGYMVNIFTLEGGRSDWPWWIYRLPSDDFNPALRHVVELSTWSNKYMASKGFVQTVPAISEQITSDEMNDLMMVALRFLPTLPYMYKAMKWRWDSYTSMSNYNQKWWEYSLKYQGTCPPVRRTEENFDPASSPRIATQYGFLSEFIGIVYSFQFHKAICEEIGHNDSLHRCSLYGEKAFGDKIRNIIYLGNSVPSPEAISIMTNGASDKMDTDPLLEYFQPLYEWLKKENKDETVGWKSDDPMVCPQNSASNPLCT